jgi:dihydrofolate reductase
MLTDRYSDVTTVVMGRRSFTGHRRVHSLKGRKPNDPRFLFDYSRFLDKVDQVCLSHRLKRLDRENSLVLKGDLAKIIAKLKGEKSGSIIIEGGPGSSTRSSVSIWLTTTSSSLCRSSSVEGLVTGTR